MPAETEALLTYWPTGAYAVALIATVFGAGWLTVAIKRFRRRLTLVATRKRELSDARSMSKAALARLKVRQGELEKLNDAAGKVFWRKEKTWIG